MRRRSTPDQAPDHQAYTGGRACAGARRTTLIERTASRVIPGAPRVPRAGVSAIVLAAGSSSRVGEPKPLLLLAGKPLLLHCLEALQVSRVNEIVVVLGAGADRIRPIIPLGRTSVVLNDAYAEGMSSSIRAGLRAASARADAFLVVLGDQPLVRPGTIDALIARHETTNARAIVPTFRGIRGNPVLLDRSLAPEMEALRGDVGCRNLIRAHAAGVVELSVDDPCILLDVDTLEDLGRLEAALREGTPLDRLVRT